MKTTATNKKVRELMTALREETLVPRPYFQRRLVWTARHKQLFIKTVLDGYPFPEIFLCDGEVDLETGKGSQLVVDGQQRITTLHQYFIASNDLRLGDVPSYKELSAPEKQAFLDYEVVVRDLGRLSDEDVREVFHRMNSTNYSLNAMEVNNARFNGALKQFAEEVSKWSFFEDHRVFAAADARRMNDVRWALTLVITLLSGYFNRDSEHEAFLRRYNDDLPERDRLHVGLEETLDLIDRLELGPGSRAWQKNDLLTLIVELYRRDPKLLLDQDALGESLRGFYSAVDVVSEGLKPTEWAEEAPAYHAAVISGSNERARRLRRAAAITKVIDPYFPTLSAKTGS
jgi:hypothetical protein